MPRAELPRTSPCAEFFEPSVTFCECVSSDILRNLPQNLGTGLEMGRGSRPNPVIFCRPMGHVVTKVATVKPSFASICRRRQRVKMKSANGDGVRTMKRIFAA